jgi:hypothetical protein
MKGLRVSGKIERWDGRLPLVPVLVLAVVFGTMLIGTSHRLVEERALRLEAERVMRTEVAELRRRLDLLRDDMTMREIDLAYERERMKETFYTGKRESSDDRIEADGGGE